MVFERKHGPCFWRPVEKNSVHNCFLGGQSPEIMNTAYGEKLRDKAAGPESYYKPGKSADELF